MNNKTISRLQLLHVGVNGYLAAEDLRGAQEVPRDQQVLVQVGDEQIAREGAKRGQRDFEGAHLAHFIAFGQADSALGLQVCDHRHRHVCIGNLDAGRCSDTRRDGLDGNGEVRGSDDFQWKRLNRLKRKRRDNVIKTTKE